MDVSFRVAGIPFMPVSPYHKIIFIYKLSCYQVIISVILVGTLDNTG